MSVMLQIGVMGRSLVRLVVEAGAGRQASRGGASFEAFTYRVVDKASRHPIA